MIRLLHYGLLFNIVLYLSGCQTRTMVLQERIARALDSVDGHFAVAFEDLSTGERILINARERFHAASTMKTAVLIEAYKQVNEGKLSLDDSIVIRNEFRSIVDGSAYSLNVAGDSDSLIYQQVGRKRTLYSLLYDMIVLSSNLAANLVIERVDARNVTRTMHDLGAKDMEVLRGVEDNKAFAKGLNNSMTAFDQLVLMSRLAKGEAVSRKASAAMMDILFDQRFRDIVPAKLPADVKVADKRGWIRGLEHDCAIVMLPDGRQYVLILLSRDLTDRDKGVDAMADVSRMVYEHVVEGG